MTTLIQYHPHYERPATLEDFLDALYSREMQYLASDLLNDGLTPGQIAHAVQRAMLAVRSAGLEVRQHFLPVYTPRDGGLMRDCKLSRFGYALVLLNAEPGCRAVARWQVRLVRRYFAPANS